MLPFGPWQPDIAGINTKVVREAINVLPAANGFRPARAAVVTANALDAACAGAIVVVKNDGSVVQFAGDSVHLYKLEPGFSIPTTDSDLYFADSTTITADFG